MALEKEFNYFLANKERLFKSHPNKFIVIVGENVVGEYESQDDALEGALKTYSLGTFLIQKVSQSEEDVTQRFFSTVYF